jgi:hypothetical protein
MSSEPEFTPFPVPMSNDDKPLVRPAGFTYRCNGCGGEVQDGAVLAEQVEDGMVVGLIAHDGWAAPNQPGPVTHRCGKVV